MWKDTITFNKIDIFDVGLYCVKQLKENTRRHIELMFPKGAFKVHLSAQDLSNRQALPFRHSGKGVNTSSRMSVINH